VDDREGAEGADDAKDADDTSERPLVVLDTRRRRQRGVRTKGGLHATLAWVLNYRD
jgi:hypothetical protein